MDTLTFITKIIDSLAWPICVLIVSWIFKRQIADLLARIRKGKIPGGEFEFSEVAKEQIAETMMRSVDDAVSQPISCIDSEGSVSDKYSLNTAYDILEVSPRAAIVEGWRSVYRAAIDSLSGYEESSSSSSSGELPRDMPPARLGVCLRDRGILQPSQIALFEELRQLRNSAAHIDDDQQITEKKATEYLVLAELLIEKLNIASDDITD